MRKKEILAIELAAQGLTQRQIGEHLGLTRSGVSKLLNRAEKKLYVLLAERGEEIKAAQTSKLDHIYRQSMQAWVESKQASVTTRSVAGGKGDRTETTMREQVGDPRFLDQARAALNDIRRIWGLDDATSREEQNKSLQIHVNFCDDFFGRTVVDSAATTKEEANGKNN